MYYSEAKELNNGYLTYPKTELGYPPTFPSKYALGISEIMYTNDKGKTSISYYVDTIPDTLRDYLNEVIDDAIDYSLPSSIKWKRDEYTSISIKINCDFHKYAKKKIPYEDWVEVLSEYDNNKAEFIIQPITANSLLEYMITCVYMVPSNNKVTISIKPTKRSLDSIALYEPAYPGLDYDDEYYVDIDI